jgi:hypothetical protein
MAVNLSPVGGVAAQFFDNDGNVLSGGKIYTYAAGSSTPQTTYTTGAGNIAHSNPIILDSAGRVPTGEIWLTDGLSYKIVIKDANDTLIGTYDNIVGINSNFINFLAEQEIQTATAGQTVFTLTTTSYQPGTNTLSVYVDGVNQYGPGAQYAYTETSSTVVTFTSGLHVGAEVKFTTAQTLSGGAIDSSQVVYDPPFANSVSTNVEAKLSQTVSVFDFMSASEIADVQAGTYSIDISGAIQNAINSGATCVMFPPGSYRMESGITITSSTPVRDIIGCGLVTLKLYTAVQSSIFEVQPGKQFLNFKNLVLTSNGTAGDGLFTYGILSISNAFTSFTDIRASNFSGAGLELRQCVYSGVTNYTAQSCFYGLSFQKYLGIQCTAVEVNRVYVSGCTRGVTQSGAVDMIYTGLVMEYCGSTTTVDAALHLDGGTAVLDFPYFEANYRNMVGVDAQATIRNIYGYGTGTAADSITYVGTAFNERGWDVSFGYKHTMARLGADTYTNRDLVIGENVTVPVAGGSVIFGNETMYSASGTLTSGTWTTVYTIPAAEVTGTAVNALAMYEYTCYAGSSDKSTGFDSGTIMNGTLRSYSGTTPAWLRLSSNLVQMNVTNVTYGLIYKIVMRRVYPGAI